MEPTTHQPKKRKRAKRSPVSGVAKKILEAMIAGRKLTAHRIYPHGFRYWLDDERPTVDELSGEEWTVTQTEVTLGAVSTLADAELIAPDQCVELDRDQFSYHVTDKGRAFKQAKPADVSEPDLFAA